MAIYVILIDPTTYIDAISNSSLDNIWMLDENGDERMTEDKQDEFNYLVDKVEAIMTDNGLVKEDL